MDHECDPQRVHLWARNNKGRGEATDEDRRMWRNRPLTYSEFCNELGPMLDEERLQHKWERLEKEDWWTKLSTIELNPGAMWQESEEFDGEAKVFKLEWEN